MTARSRAPSVRRTLVPLALMLVCPPAVIVLWMIVARFDGSVRAFLARVDLPTFLALCPRPTFTALAMLLGFAALQVALLVGLPAEIHEGPVTPAGHRPRYRRNGLAAFLVTHALLAAASLGLGLFRPGAVYDQLGPMLVTADVLALVLCVALYVKGIVAPSSADAGRSGNPVFDFFWGVELHPTLAGISLKQLFNCRLGMMSWSVVVLSCAAKQYEAHGRLSTTMLVSAALQVAYVAKFFRWETGYFGSLDVTHDRCGFYLVCGVLVWVPGMYTLVAQHLVRHPVEWPLPAAALCLACGLAAIWANHDADAQRQRVRERGAGASVWGRPPEVIVARYTAGDGVERESLLLVSGWWGVARHVHYVAEIAAALAWTLPAGFGRAVPWLYVTFLTVLLVDRAGRDDRRCRAKYGPAWQRYCERVPWRILPFVY
jgi:7-dehydrocholesterol reductase